MDTVIIHEESKDDEKKEIEREESIESRVNLEEIVLFENNRYFIPLKQSKQRIIPFIEQIIDDYMEDQHDLNEIDKLLEDNGTESVDNDNIYSPKDMDDGMNDNDKIIYKLEKNLFLQHKKLALLSFRFDQIEDFIGNITDSSSLLLKGQKQNKRNEKKWVIDPVIDYLKLIIMDTKAPFNADFFYGLLRIPFMLYQFERIFVFYNLFNLSNI